MTLEAITEKLRSQLKESRFVHSLNVAQTAKTLALRFGANADKAYLAGLVHDCAKCYSEEELICKMKQYGLDDECDFTTATQLLHSFVGAYELKEKFGIDDEEVFDAVYYHTIGKEAMPMLTAIVYLADAIEPARDYPGVDEIRSAARISLEKAIYMYTEGSIAFVNARGWFLHPNSLKVRDYYRQSGRL